MKHAPAVWVVPYVTEYSPERVAAVFEYLRVEFHKCLKESEGSSQVSTYKNAGRRGFAHLGLSARIQLKSPVGWWDGVSGSKHAQVSLEVRGGGFELTHLAIISGV